MPLRSRDPLREKQNQPPKPTLTDLMFKFIVSLVLLPSFAIAGDWQLYRSDGRDYVSLKNIASFYSLRPAFLTDDPTRGGYRQVTNHISRSSGVGGANAASEDAEGLFSSGIALRNGKEELRFKANSREMAINGVTNWLSFPVRAQNGQLLVSRIDLAKTIDPIMRPRLIPNSTVVKTVVLDPGHGGHDRGAVNAYGDEKTYTLDVCRRLKPLLQAEGLRVVMTRESDEFVPLQQRAAVANAIPNSIFVAVHFNSASTNASGVEVFSITPKGAPSTASDSLRRVDFREEPGNATDAPSAALAASVCGSILNRQAQADRGLKRARFAVIRLAKVPSILIEGGFLSNRTEAQSIRSDVWRQHLAESIADGIVSYRGSVAPRQGEAPAPELISAEKTTRESPSAPAGTKRHTRKRG